MDIAHALCGYLSVRDAAAIACTSRYFRGIGDEMMRLGGIVVPFSVLEEIATQPRFKGGLYSITVRGIVVDTHVPWETIIMSCRPRTIVLEFDAFVCGIDTTTDVIIDLFRAISSSSSTPATLEIRSSGIVLRPMSEKGYIYRQMQRLVGADVCVFSPNVRRYVNIGEQMARVKIDGTGVEDIEIDIDPIYMNDALGRGLDDTVKTMVWRLPSRHSSFSCAARFRTLTMFSGTMRVRDANHMAHAIRSLVDLSPTLQHIEIRLDAPICDRLIEGDFCGISKALRVRFQHLESLHIWMRFPPVGLTTFISECSEELDAELIVSIAERPGQGDIDELFYLVNMEHIDLDNNDVMELSDRIHIAQTSFPISWKWWHNTKHALDTCTELSRIPSSMHMRLNHMGVYFR
jgi:hypothetical protein